MAGYGVLGVGGCVALIFGRGGEPDCFAVDIEGLEFDVSAAGEFAIVIQLFSEDLAAFL